MGESLEWRFTLALLSQASPRGHGTCLYSASSKSRQLAGKGQHLAGKPWLKVASGTWLCSSAKLPWGKQRDGPYFLGCDWNHRMELGSGAWVGPGGLLLPGGQCQLSTAVSYRAGKELGLQELATDQ